jgi:DNA-binding winged helix-turn-helix (wHTH) protein
VKVLKASINGRSDARTSERYGFGPYRLDCRTRELWLGDEVVALTPKAFDLLRVLVTSGGRVVEKSELMQLVWPDSFVSEDSLTQNIATLRKALGDSPDRPRYIATVPRRGYRFVTSVQTAYDPTDSPSVPDRLDEAPEAVSPGAGRDALGELKGARTRGNQTSGWWARKVFGISTAALLVAAGLTVASFHRPSSASLAMRFVVTAPEGTTFSPSASFLTVSPDGRLLAFLAFRPGEETRIWVRSLDSLIARELPGTDGALAPFWAPDSHYLGFFAHQQLKTVRLVGEPPRTLCDLQPGNTDSATWSPDGVILFANRDAIWRISSTGHARDDCRLATW